MGQKNLFSSKLLLICWFLGENVLELNVDDECGLPFFFKLMHSNNILKMDL